MAGDTGKIRANEASRPAISMLREMDESSIGPASLNLFLDAEIEEENYQRETLTQFMKKYVVFRVFGECITSDSNLDDLSGASSNEGSQRQFFKILCNVAFHNIVMSRDLKWNYLRKKFILDAPELFGKTHKPGLLKVLKQTEGAQGNLWSFKERFVQTYLAACFQVEKLLKVASVKNKRKFMGKKLTKSINQMPETYDMWLLTFGLASREMRLTCRLREIVLEFFGIFRRAIGKMSVRSTHPKGEKRQWIPKGSSHRNEGPCSVSDHVSCFFVELVFETSNADDLLSVSDRILENESINYSGLNMSKGRIFYCLNAIAGFLNFVPDLYGIHLTNMNVREEGIKMVLEPLLNADKITLQVMNLSNSSIRYREMSTLFRFLVRASDLTHLDLSHCDLGDRGISPIVQAFMCMPLVYLNLSGNGIGVAGSRFLSYNLCCVPSIEWLDLSSNNIGEAASELTSVMAKLPRLRFLNLGSNKLNDEGAIALARLIGESSTMEEVVASRNVISGRGCRALADKVARSRSIKSLDVRNNKIPNSGVVKLRKAARSHGSLQVATWEQNPDLTLPDSDSDCGKDHGEDGPDKVVVKLDFQLSLAFSKAGGGRFCANMNEAREHSKTSEGMLRDFNSTLCFAPSSIASISDTSINLDESAVITQDISFGDMARFSSRPSGDVGGNVDEDTSTPKNRSASTGKINIKTFLASKRRSMGERATTNACSYEESAHPKGKGKSILKGPNAPGKGARVFGPPFRPMGLQ